MRGTLQSACLRAALPIAVAAGIWIASRSPAEPPSGSAPAEPTAGVDFRSDVVPILESRCVRCHVGESARAEFRMDTRRTFLKGGGMSGEVVVPGHSDESYLLDLVSGLEPDRIMPMAGERLTAEEIGILTRWINQGLAWEKDFDLGARFESRIFPRRPEIPASARDSDLINAIDRFLAGYFAEHGIEPPEPVDDRVFARRVALDLVGLLPSPEELEAFTADNRPDKRTRQVQRLLDDREAYAAHWLTFWNDALRNAYRGTGYIDGGRRQVTGWLYDALYHNKPYDRFVAELVNPSPDSEGFVMGIKWRGVVNASQRREMQAAQSVSQVFLGTNLKCASCHDSFVNQWLLADSYGLASAFADEPLEIHRCDKPIGATAAPRFIFPQLGTIDPAAPKAERMRRLAELITSPKNGRLARTIVNRLWARLFGRGLVEPLEEMEEPPWHRDLLDFLAADLQDHGYDLKHTLKLICTSRVYQLPAVGAPGPDETRYVFRGPYVRRMEAEQFLDAASTVTGVWPEPTSQMTRPAGRGPGGQLTAVRAVLRGDSGRAGPDLAAVKWIWSHAEAGKRDPGGRIFLRKTFHLDAIPDRAVAGVTCDNELTLYVNGHKAASSDDWTRPVRVDLTKHLVEGANTLAAEAINWPDEETGRGLEHRGKPNPAGFALLAVGYKGSEPAWTVASDASWIWRQGLQDGWQRPDHDTRGWKHAAGACDAGDLTPRLASLVSQTEAGGATVRSAIRDNDPLARALGRPNREQVVTRRDSIATTLQALELSNGPTLDRMLVQGAQHWLKRFPDDGQRLATELYRAALGRRPNAEELAIAVELVGSQPTAQGVEDLLWTVLLLPEFQLIY